MRSLLKWLACICGVLLFGVMSAAQAGLWKGEPPSDIGVRGGLLKPPSLTANSVSSQADLHANHPQRTNAAIGPLALRDGNGPATLARLKSLLAGMDGITLVKSEVDYLYVQASTRWMGFVDDLEFWHDSQAQVIQVRSASRVGSSDMGVNRQRVELLRAALKAMP
jgi:uncharacterized protein (DUF1499 family)